MHRCVFLDRDNTLIRNDGDLGDPERVELIQGAASAVASLRGLGYRVVVITNQGGVARGRYKEAAVQAVHARLNDLIAHYANGARIDAFYYCPYHPEGNLKQYRKDHPDRKPQPGMLLRAAEDLSLDLTQSWMVGDQVRDVQAGAAAGTRTILLRPDAERLAHVDPSDLQGLDPELAQTVSTPPRRVPDFFAHDLVEAVRIIAQQRKPEATADPKLAGKFHGRKWDAAAIAELQRTGRPPKPADAAEQEDAEAPTQSPAASDPRSPAAAATSDRGDSQADSDTKPRPFRPWGTSEPRAYIDTPIARAIRARRKAQEQQQQREADAAASSATPAPTAASTAAPPATPAVEEPGTSAVEASAAAAAPAVEHPAVAAPSQPAEAEAPAPPPASDAHAAAAEAPARESSSPPRAASHAAASEEPVRVTASSVETDKLLRQILQELRAQRGEAPEFSSLTIVAIVMQMAAVLCLVGGLWMGGEEDGLFIRWLGAGLLVQLATIALLLFDRRR